jgi:hypothetical protein
MEFTCPLAFANMGAYRAWRAFGVVELQRAGQRVQNAVGHSAEVSAFEAGVVLDADAGERGDLATAEAFDPAGAVRGYARLLRADLRAA